MVTEARTTEDGATPSSPVEAVDRALLALQALAQAGARGASLAELASVLELNKTTLHRTLAALRYRGFVAQDPASGAYVLGPSATQLADDYLSDENLPALLHPALVALSGAAAELAHLGVLSGRHVIYLDKVEPDRSVRVWSAVGRRSPAVTTALGRALLAYQHLDRSLLPSYLGVAEDSRSAARVPEAEELWTTLESARERGYATEVEENEPGISCLAVPLLRAGAAVAAVSITAPAERMTPDRVEALHEQMRTLLPPLLPTGLNLPA
ncbi:IclR family transcriptional regulator [Bogoriella caseilytica]|uniref:IclR family transcriptional regulator n=1 Tax=Bogoriella caseilytica TaxID=56055 RepID=A0A3N2BCW0_9MICO|nr:IclR family transcriptional regulator [Bogoriella caseilytica]ROR73075.1 IclR family transcriptional regulator [Bogoriella caseilytica]